MSGDDESELIAMQPDLAYEMDNGWIPTDVSTENVGYDIRSVNNVLVILKTPPQYNYIF